MTPEGIKDILLNLVFYGVALLGVGFVMTMLILHIAHKVYFKDDLLAIFGLLLTVGMTVIILLTFFTAPAATAMEFILMGFGMFLTLSNIKWSEPNR